MITLENEHLTVIVKQFGAELTSVIDRKTGYEFIWQADTDYWTRRAPILFPVVGRLKDNQYTYQNLPYEMTKHGFARDSLFEVVDIRPKKVLLRLSSSEETKKYYPFDFELYIQYKLLRKQVITKFKVVNKSDKEQLHYLIGGHPGFNVGHTGSSTEDVEFNQVSLNIQPETEITYYPLSEEGLIRTHGIEKVIPGELQLTHEVFKDDALVFEVGEAKTFTLKDEGNQVSIRMQTSNLPYLGIWSPYPTRAPFVCVEPLAGLADVEGTTGNYEEKIGVTCLEPNQYMLHEYCVRFKKYKE